MPAQPDTSHVARGIARPTITVLAGSGTALAGTLAVRIILARALTPAEVGALILTIALATALGAVASLGLAAAAGRHIAELLSLGRRDDAGRAARTALGVSLLVGMAAAMALAAMAVLSDWLPGGSATRALVPFVAPVVLGVALGQTMIGVARGFGDATGRAMVRDGLGGLLRVVGVTVAVVLDGRPEAVALGFAGGALLSEFAYSLYCGVHGWFRGRSGSDGALLRSLPPYAALELLSQASLWMDILVLGALAPAAAVGYYGIARGLTRATGMAFIAATHSFLPSATGFLAAGRNVLFLRLYRRARTLVLAITWPVIAVTLFAPVAIIEPLFGREYVPGAEALRWLGVALLLDWLASFKDNGLLARGDSRTVAAVGAGATVAGLIALLLAIPVMGATGAALAVVTQTSVRLVALTAVARRRLATRWSDDLPPVVLVAVALGVGGGWLAVVFGVTGLEALLAVAGSAGAGSLLLLFHLWRTADRGRTPLY